MNEQLENCFTCISSSIVDVSVSILSCCYVNGTDSEQVLEVHSKYQLTTASVSYYLSARHKQHISVSH